jgi:hypothetical protein
LQKAEVAGDREYFPNADGYSWTYKMTCAISSTSEVLTFTVRATFAGPTTSETPAIKWLKLEIFTPTFSSTSEKTLAMGITDLGVKDYGLLAHFYYIASAYPLSTNEGYSWFAFPLSIGNKWTFGQSTEASVIGQENVIVPAGTYSCFKAIANSPLSSSVTLEGWLAKNVGLVKARFYFTYTNGTLESYLLELVDKNF